MMLLLDGIILGLLLGVLRQGSLRTLSTHKLRGEGLLAASLPALVVLPSLAEWLGVGQPEFIGLWLLCTALLVGISLQNSQHLGMLVLALGLSLNIVVVAGNGAMPVDVAGVPPVSDSEMTIESAVGQSRVHEVLTSETRLPALADRVWIPGPKWHRGLASVGDLIASLGAGMTIFAMTTSPRGRPTGQNGTQGIA